jgi:hypothetical protein
MYIYEYFSVLQSCEKCCKFLAVCRACMMTLCECCVDSPFPYYVIRCWVSTRPLPLQYGHWITYLNPLFGA